LLTCSDASSKYTKKSTPRCVFTTGESRLPGVFTTRESFYGF
jgi:hypothetical protein